MLLVKAPSFVQSLRFSVFSSFSLKKNQSSTIKLVNKLNLNVNQTNYLLNSSYDYTCY